MELPKNITQIGESNRRCKIYVEDYVISYMKQLNMVARDKDMAVALYGIHREENDVSYLFLYGACKLTFLQRETRHLSQAQQQEIERYRTKYFPEYSFLGYRLLNGEMIEGFHVCEQGICRYIEGYAQFYEKNDSMLAYMLDAREEVQPEVVNQEKYEAVKKKQEERRLLHEESKLQKTVSPGNAGSIKGMRVAVVAVFAILCLIGLTSMNGEHKIKDLQAVARQVIDDAMKQQIPDAIQTNTLIAEDKLAEAVFQENAAESVQTSGTVMPEPVSAEETVATSETETTDVSEEVTETESTNVSENEEDLSATETEERQTEATENVDVSDATDMSDAQPVSYTIKEGDTLIGISLRNYGSDTRVGDICSLNQIINPDDIKVGQKILLP